MEPEVKQETELMMEVYDDEGTRARGDFPQSQTKTNVRMDNATIFTNIKTEPIEFDWKSENENQSERTSVTNSPKDGANDVSNRCDDIISKCVDVEIKPEPPEIKPEDVNEPLEIGEIPSKSRISANPSSESSHPVTVSQTISSAPNSTSSDPDRPFKCEHCDATFTMYRNLCRHIDSIHTQGCAQFQCLRCDKVFNQSRYLRAHEKRHLMENAHTWVEHAVTRKLCGTNEATVETTNVEDDTDDDCLKVDQFLSDIDRTLIPELRFIPLPDLGVENVLNLDKPFRCEQCGRSFISTESLLRHIEAHNQGAAFHKCEFCGKNFSQARYLQTHVKVHTGDRRYKCKYCEKTFIQSSAMIIHVRRRHTGEKPYKCESCEKCFADGTEMKRHSATHSDEQPHKCSICGKCFSQTHHLRGHQRVHTGEKPFGCDLCGKFFADRTTLKNHIWTHMKKPTYHCETCGKDLGREKDLINHAKMHNGEKFFECEHCGRCFSQMSDLNKHLKSVHPDDKPNICVLCDQVFTTPTKLKNHEKIHERNTSQNLQYDCEHCNKSFKSVVDLSEHAKVHLEEVMCISSNDLSKEENVETEQDGKVVEEKFSSIETRTVETVDSV